MNMSTKITVLCLVGLLPNAAFSLAATKYVSNNLTITLRTGPGGDRKIIAQPRVGTPLEVINAGNDYTEVRTPSGKQGFVLTRFLTAKVPDGKQLAQLQAEHARIVEKYDTLKMQATEFDTTSKGLSGDLASTQKALEKLTLEHETLKNEAQGYLQLKAKYEKAVKEASGVRARADKLDKELQQATGSQLTTGILYGGGFVVLGFIVGFIVKKPRRRSGLM